MSGAQAALLPDGRLHLHHGPIDLVIEVAGAGRDAALSRAAGRFETVLDELVPELARLRAPAGPTPRGAVARRMVRAVAPHGDVFVTPMAAVAGSVADEILAAILAGPGVVKAHVNNGGDIALHLGPGQVARALLAASPPARIEVARADGVGGIATSGWRGRSHSLGIADSVTVLAPDAAAADVAATLIANAVDLPGHPAIARRPARSLSPDSDLGARLVTVAVGALAPQETAAALAAGARRADTLRARGLILGAALILDGQMRVSGALSLPAPRKEPAHA